MQGTIDGFSHGVVTPVAAFLMACLGAALGLRCTTRSLRTERSFKAGWLALGATSIGSGIWTMHFVAMTGFTIDGAAIGYDKPITFASLAVAIGMVAVGIFVVGYRGATRMALMTGGTIIGLGMATMHYLGMAGMRLEGRFEYDTVTVVLSVVIAVVAATAALWAAVSVQGFLAGLGASVLMGVAVSGMHYTGMAALSVHLHPAALTGEAAADSSAVPLLPLLVGPGCFLLLAAVVVMFDPLMVMGTPDWNDTKAGDGADGRAGVPAPRQVPSFGTYADPASFHSRPRDPAPPGEW
ncbi:MHYT domain-containing protein [Streptomyces sp. NPDC001834]|uniref:MHYT domain-containing protein n=1 Tax=Streptomyces sp. NPDC001834 TaxID=3364616 RepID=UPI0036BD5821